MNNIFPLVSLNVNILSLVNHGKLINQVSTILQYFTLRLPSDTPIPNLLSWKSAIVTAVGDLYN